MLLLCRHGPHCHSHCRTGLFSSASAWRKFWTFFVLKQRLRTEKCCGTSLPGLSVLCASAGKFCLPCWRSVFCALIKKFWNWLHLSENTMWSSPNVFNGTVEKIEKVLGAPPHEMIFRYLVVVGEDPCVDAAAEPWELHWPLPAFIWNILPGLYLNEITLGPMDFWVQSI